MKNNTELQDATKVTNGIIIDMGNNNTTDAETLKTDLIRLRELIRCLAIASYDSDVSAARYEGEMIVLHWLIEDVELKDIRA